MFYRRVLYSMSPSCVLFALVSSAAFAQVTGQAAPTPVFNAPPEVEQALRTRVTEFFQLHVEENFRKAYGIVAEDTKDYYFNNKKNTYESFRITGVKFLNSDFTKASVDLECKQKMQRFEFKGVVIPVPMTTLWKIEDGKWMWYRDPNATQLTPMGASDLDKVRPGDKLSEAQLAEQLRKLTSPEEMAKRAGKIFGQSGIDKQEVTLALDKPSSAEVTFHNGQPGSIKLVLDPGMKLAGFSATLDKEDVGANEDAVLKLSYEPPAGNERATGGEPPSAARSSSPQTTLQAVRVRLYVQPFNQVFAVKVNFGTPAAANH